MCNKITNAYHLEATLKARTSTVDLKLYDSNLFFFLNNFEWSHYSVDDFKKEWPPSKFK